ncbi:metallophosphoesterase [Candidatus Woesearchaeota archaeon]|jgi:uncharacterized protein|nr:metallophosphoesterase [Candidatus Woesearchaeota archaeon]MBT6044850.1 metallophosphoesterase [Candidatus Woesearchaeota archaeon]
MNIHEDIEIVDLALRHGEVLILGDLQLGYEDYLNKKGVLVPRFQTEDVLGRIREILENTRVKKIVFNGDIKHHFGRISPQEWDSVTRLMEDLVDKYEVIIVKGNHDVLIEPILKRFKDKIKLVDYFEIDDLFITHGDKIMPNPGKIIVIGHEHPAVSFGEKPGEKYKCFLKGKWGGHKLIVMPSFNMLTAGSDIKREKFLSPYLKGNLNNFEIYVVEDKTYYFGKIKNLPE